MAPRKSDEVGASVAQLAALRWTVVVQALMLALVVVVHNIANEGINQILCGMHGISL